MPLLIKSSVSQPDSSWNRSPSPPPFFFFFSTVFLRSPYLCSSPVAARRAFSVPSLFFARLSPLAGPSSLLHLPLPLSSTWFLRRSPHGSFFFRENANKFYGRSVGIGMSNALVSDGLTTLLLAAFIRLVEDVTFWSTFQSWQKIIFIQLVIDIWYLSALSNLKCFLLSNCFIYKHWREILILENVLKNWLYILDWFLFTFLSKFWDLLF